MGLRKVNDEIENEVQINKSSTLLTNDLDNLISLYVNPLKSLENRISDLCKIKSSTDINFDRLNDMNESLQQLESLVVNYQNAKHQYDCSYLNNKVIYNLKDSLQVKVNQFNTMLNKEHNEKEMNNLKVESNCDFALTKSHDIHINKSRVVQKERVIPIIKFNTNEEYNNLCIFKQKYIDEANNIQNGDNLKRKHMFY